MTHKKAYEKYYGKLKLCLPMNDEYFIAALSDQNLLPPYIKSELEAFPKQTKKASYFLDNVIGPALDIDNTDTFDKLLSVMEHCGYGHVEKLAHEIKSEIAKTSDSKNVYRKYHLKLERCLPMNDEYFIAALSDQNLLPPYIKSEVKALPTQVKKASYFLDYVIGPALDIDDADNFNMLLSIMEHCGHGHVEKLGCEIKSEISKTSSSKSGMDIRMCVRT